MFEGALTIATPPASEPVSLAQAKLHLRVDGSDEDALITSLIVTARKTCEQWSGRSFMAQTWDLWLNAFPSRSGRAASMAPPDAILLPRPPLVSVTYVKYTDTAQVLQTLTEGVDYFVDDTREPGQVLPAYGKTWPAALDYVNVVQVRYLAGEADAANVDERAKQAMLLLVGHWYENREAVLTGATSREIEMAARTLMHQLWHGVL